MHVYVLCGYMYYAMILSLSVRRQGEHNELLAQVHVAKRAERVQLLVHIIDNGEDAEFDIIHVIIIFYFPPYIFMVDRSLAN